MFVHDGTLWIETGTGLAAFDPTRAEETDRIRIPGGIFGVQDTPTGFWGVAGQGQLLQIDPDTREVVGRVEVDGRCSV